MGTVTVEVVTPRVVRERDDAARGHRGLEQHEGIARDDVVVGAGSRSRIRSTPTATPIATPSCDRDPESVHPDRAAGDLVGLDGDREQRGSAIVVEKPIAAAKR